MDIIHFLFSVTKNIIPWASITERDTLKTEMETEYRKMLETKIGKSSRKFLDSPWFRFGLAALFIPVQRWLYNLTFGINEVIEKPELNEEFIR